MGHCSEAIDDVQYAQLAMERCNEVIKVGVLVQVAWRGGMISLTHYDMVKSRYAGGVEHGSRKRRF
jgi:hypothetical protein